MWPNTPRCEGALYCTREWNSKDCHAYSTRLGTPGLYRCREDLVEVLLAHGGVDINWRNFGGESMLSIAKCGEDWEIVEFLISKGAHE